MAEKIIMIENYVFIFIITLYRISHRTPTSRDFLGTTYRDRLRFSQKEEKRVGPPIAIRQLSRPIVEFPAFGCDCETGGGGMDQARGTGGISGERAVLRDLLGVSRIRFHGPEVDVVFALSIGFPSVV